MYYILDRLAVGAVTDALNLPKEITALLNCTEEHDTSREGIDYLKIPLVDFEPINPECIPRAVEWIKDKIVSHRILVHCNAGIGRSSSIAVCYLYEIGFSFEEAVKLVKKKNPLALPHRELRSAIMISRRISSKGAVD